MKLVMIFFLNVIFIFGEIGSPALKAQVVEPHDFRFYNEQALLAYKKKDFAGFLKNMQQAERLLPSYPPIIYNLADAYALIGQSEQAIFYLNRLVAMRLFYPLEKDDDFAGLKNTNEFQDVLSKLAGNLTMQGAGKSQTALTVPEKGLIAESIGFDRASGDYFLSSVYRREILRINKNGEAKVFADSGSGLWSPFGLKIDAAHRRLWVASAAFKQMPDLIPGEEGQSGIFMFDLDSGKLLHKFIIPKDSFPHSLGDLAISASGDVYATDSETPAVYVIKHNTNEISLFLKNKSFINLQGLDFSKDDRFLMIADYIEGIFKVDIKTKTVDLLASDSNTAVSGVDGLYVDGDSLVVTQNGITPQRVAQFYLSKNMKRIERARVLCINEPQFDDITLGFVEKNDFYFIANSQWNLLGEKGKFTRPENLKPLVVEKTQLK